MIKLVLLCIGLNIVSQLAVIRKDHEHVTRCDYWLFLIQSLFIVVAMVMARYIYEVFKQIIG